MEPDIIINKITFQSNKKEVTVEAFEKPISDTKLMEKNVRIWQGTTYITLPIQDVMNLNGALETMLNFLTAEVVTLDE